MESSSCSYQELPFSRLFKSYTSDFNTLSNFYHINPFDKESVTKWANSIKSRIERSDVIEALTQFHTELGIIQDQKDALSKFSQENALVIVTGQQLGMYGGPLFTVYKTLTAIKLAKEWEKRLQVPVVPVFWLADEDHDFKEIASIGIPGFDDFNTVGLATSGNNKPVSEQIIDESLDAFNTELREILPNTDFSPTLWSQLTECYKEGDSYVQSFAKLMSSWFSKHGVLFAGSNHESIKNLTRDALVSSVQQSDGIFESLTNQSQKIESDFHSQVLVTESNLFYLGDQGREKIKKEGDRWFFSGKEFSSDELSTLINEHPEKFSPNVFMRPILQDVLLPTIGYVAGPGELAYYGQMKQLYPHFNLEMPVIFPRFSATLLESGIQRILEKLPLELTEFNQRIEDLEASYLEKTNAKEIDDIFNTWISSIKESAESPISVIKSIDSSLVGMAGKVTSGFENELNKFRGRVIKSIKQQDETQLKRISKIKSQLFPSGLQERSVSPIFYMNKYGLNIWDELLAMLDASDLDLSVHHILHI